MLYIIIYSLINSHAQSSYYANLRNVEHRPEFKKISPLGKVPVLVTPQGPLLESNAIARFIARHAPAKGLMGGSFFEQAQVDSWVDWHR